ncbi:MAG: hypothetical protein IAE82_00625 [Opitutaceae bacterium]|nr:hypothetical protein [Opitutaceae bacterium]
MSRSAQNLVYTGSKHEVKVFGDGQVVMHTTRQSATHLVTVASLSHADHTIRTLDRLTLRALLGPCDVTLRPGRKKTLRTGATMRIPMGATFTLKATAAVIEITPELGPGLGTGPGDDDRYP